MPFCKIRDLGGIWALGRGRRRRPHTERPATAHSRKHAGQLQRCTLSGVLQPMARHGRNLGRDSSGTNIDTWRAPREMQGTRRNTYHLWDSCAPPCVKKAQCAGDSRSPRGGASPPCLPRPGRRRATTGPILHLPICHDLNVCHHPERRSFTARYRYRPAATSGQCGPLGPLPRRRKRPCHTRSLYHATR